MEEKVELIDMYIGAARALGITILISIAAFVVFVVSCMSYIISL